MKHSLFWRLFWAFLGALGATVLVMALIMVTLVRSERQLALENELRVQARDLAQLIKQGYSTPFWQLDTASIQWKIDEIRADYDAQISILYSTGHLQRASVFTADLSDAALLDLINRVIALGDEIRVQGVFSDSPGIVTIGVPYENAAGSIVGAIFLHVSLNRLAVDYTDIIRYASLACLVSLLLGAALAYWIARRQSRPLREIKRAVSDFSEGQFDRRVEVTGDGDLSELAASFNKMAQQLSALEQSRRDFVANVSHELRSPMTSIQGYIHGILDGTVAPEERTRYLNVVLDETRRLTKLVGELLELSRFESGNIALNLTRFDINALMLSVLFKYEQRIEAKKIDMEISFREPQCYVLADVDRFTQVIENLVDNAVKFTQEGGTITAWTHTVDALCYVTIKNTGEGIDPNDLPFIFDRFYKGDKAHTSGMGTGLGLAIARRILEQHGQSITATSCGDEACFVFTAPKADQA